MFEAPHTAWRAGDTVRMSSLPVVGRIAIRLGSAIAPILAGLALGFAPGVSGADEFGDRAATARLADMERTGVLTDPFWAQAFWARSREAPLRAAAISDLRWALRFDPDLHRARLDLVTQLLLDRDPEAASQVVTIGERFLASFPAQQWLLATGLALLIPAVAVGLALFTLVAIGRSVPRVYYGLLERLQFLPAEIRAASALLTIALPLLLALTLAPTAALFWTLGIGTVGTWGILARWERRLAGAALVVLLLSPFGLAAWTRVAEPTRPDSYLRCLWVTQSALDAQAGANLHRLSPPKAKNDPDHLATLALLERRMGRYPIAAGYLEDAIKRAPDRWALHNNLGNVRLLAGDVDGAIAAYGEALARGPDAAVVYVNRAQARVRKLEFTKADADIRRAADLGYHFPRILTSNSERLIVRDDTLALAGHWSRFLHGVGSRERLEWSRATEMALAIAFPIRPPWMAAPLFLALWFASRARNLYRTFPCATCGKLITRRSHFRVLRRSLCGPCYEVRQTNTAPLLRQQLLAERRHRINRVPRLFGTLIAALLPGSGHLLAGSPRQGGLRLIVAALLVCVAVMLARVGPAYGAPGDPRHPILPLGFTAATYGLLALLSVRFYRNRRQEEDTMPAGARGIESHGPGSA